MDKLREVTEYMSQMKIKKTLLGGYDKNDVAEKLNTMELLFQKCVDAYEAEEKTIIADYEKRMAAMDTVISELNQKISELTAEQEKAIVEQEKLKAAYKECCSAILTEYSDSIRSLSVEFTHVLENVAKLQKGLKENAIFEQLGVHKELQEDNIEVNQ